MDYPPSLPPSLSPLSLPSSLSPFLPLFPPFPSPLSQGESVIQVEAIDQDEGLNESVTYLIVSGNDPLGGEPSFGINSTTGVIFVNVTSLDRERTAVYTLTVMVRGCETLSPFFHLLSSPSPLFLPLRSLLPPPSPTHRPLKSTMPTTETLRWWILLFLMSTTTLPRSHNHSTTPLYQRTPPLACLY